MCNIVDEHNITFIESLRIHSQSAKLTTVSHFHNPIPLVAVASFHNEATVYNWMEMGADATTMVKYPSSPVVFVLREGVYHCQISAGSTIKAVTPMRVVLKAADNAIGM